QRLKTTPTLPGWMMVNEDHTAAIRTSTSPSTMPLASAAGTLGCRSSVMALLSLELAVAPLLEHHGEVSPPRVAAEKTGDAALQPAAQRAERRVERENQPEQDDELAGAGHDPCYSPGSAGGPTADGRDGGRRARNARSLVRERERRAQRERLHLSARDAHHLDLRLGRAHRRRQL